MLISYPLPALSKPGEAVSQTSPIRVLQTSSQRRFDAFFFETRPNFVLIWWMIP